MTFEELLIATTARCRDIWRAVPASQIRGKQGTLSELGDMLDAATIVDNINHRIECLKAEIADLEALKFQFTASMLSTKLSALRKAIGD